MVALLAPARSATASMLIEVRPCSSSSSLAARRIAFRDFSLRGRPRRGTSAATLARAMPLELPGVLVAEVERRGRHQLVHLVRPAETDDGAVDGRVAQGPRDRDGAGRDAQA